MRRGIWLPQIGCSAWKSRGNRSVKIWVTILWLWISRFSLLDVVSTGTESHGKWLLNRYILFFKRIVQYLIHYKKTKLFWIYWCFSNIGIVVKSLYSAVARIKNIPIYTDYPGIHALNKNIFNGLGMIWYNNKQGSHFPPSFPYINIHYDGRLTCSPLTL